MPRILGTLSPLAIAKRQNAQKSLGMLSRKVFPINFVPQQEVFIIERFGKFSRQKEGGVMWKIPFLEEIAYVQVMKELVIKVDGQKAITKDNVTVDLDGVLYIKVRVNAYC